MSSRLAGHPLPRVSPSRANSGARWDVIQAQAHRPEIQALIRRAIAAGSIRVVPNADGGLRIIPILDRPPQGR